MKVFLIISTVFFVGCSCSCSCSVSDDEWKEAEKYCAQNGGVEYVVAGPRAKFKCNNGLN